MEVSKEARSQTVKAAKAVAAAREATMELDKVIYWEKASSFPLLLQLLYFIVSLYVLVLHPEREIKGSNWPRNCSIQT